MRKVFAFLNFVSPLFLLLPMVASATSQFYLLAAFAATGLMSSLYSTLVILKKPDSELTLTETLVASYSTIVILGIAALLASVLGTQ